MDEFEDLIRNNPALEKLLSEYVENAHVPFELIYADAEGKLSNEGHSKINLHIEKCEECREAYQFIRESIADGAESDESPVNVRLNPKLISKMKLVSVVNSKRDEIAEKVAQLILPEDMWFTIKPSIEVYRNWIKSSVSVEPVESEKIPVAAFSGDDTEDMEEFEIVIDSIRFSDYLCDMLAEQCGTLDEIGEKLPNFIDDGAAVFDKIEIDEGIRGKVVEIVKGIFEEQ